MDTLSEDFESTTDCAAMDLDEPIAGQPEEDPDEAFGRIKLRDYQKALLEKAVHSNLLITLSTSNEQILIAVGLIRRLLHQTEGPFPEVARRTVFLAPTKALVQQHYEVIRKYVAASVEKVYPKCKHQLDNAEQWHQLLTRHQVLLITPDCLSNAIVHGFLKFEQINLMIFDEVHWALPFTQVTTNFRFACGYYSQVMKNYQRQTCQLPFKSLPRVLAMEATIFTDDVSLKSIRKTLNGIKALCQATMASEETAVCGKRAQVIVKDADETEFEAFKQNDLVLYKAIFEEAETTIRKIFLESTRTATQLMEALKAVGGMVKLGPWFVVEALYICIQSIGYSADLHSMAGGLLQLFTNMQAEIRMKHSRPQSALNQNNIDFATNSPHSDKLNVLLNYLREKSDCLNCIIIVNEPLVANVIWRWIKLLAENVPEYRFIKPGFICDNSESATFFYYDSSTPDFKQQFEAQQLNLLVTTPLFAGSGVDVPLSSVVFQYDLPETYRAFVLSKGRARNADSSWILLVDSEREMATLCEQRLAKYKAIDKYFKNINAIQRFESSKGRSAADFNSEVETTKLELTEEISSTTLHYYTQKLPVDIFTNKQGKFHEMGPSEDGNDATMRYCCAYTFPCWAPYTGAIVGYYRATKREAKMSCCFEVCKLLIQMGELDDQLRAVTTGALLRKHRDELKLKVINTTGLSRCKLVHGGYTSKYFTQLSLPQQDQPVQFYLYQIDVAESEGGFDLGARNEPTIGFITAVPFPCTQIELPLYQLTGSLKFTVSFNSTVQLADSAECKATLLVKYFHWHVVENIIWRKNPSAVKKKHWTLPLEAYRSLNLYIVPLVKRTAAAKYEIDYDTIVQLQSWMQRMADLRRKRTKRDLTMESVAEQFSPGTLVAAYNQANLSLITVITSQKATLPTDTFFHQASERLGVFPEMTTISYAEYFCQRGITIQNLKLPLICGKATNSDNGCKFFTAPKNVKQPTIPADLEETCKLPPELLFVYPLPLRMVRLCNALPALFYRLEQFALAHELLSDRILNKVHSFAFDQQFSIDSLFVEAKAFQQGDAVTVKSIDEETLLFYEVIKLDQIAETRIVSKVYGTSDQQHSRLLKLQEAQQALDRLKPLFPLVEQNGILANMDQLPEPVYGSTSLFHYSGHIEEHISYSFDTYHKQTFPNPWCVIAALTPDKANDIWSLERLKIVGGSFFNMSTALYLFFNFLRYDEGKLNHLKEALTNSEQLYKLALGTNLQEIVQSNSADLESNPLLSKSSKAKNVKKIKIKPQDLVDSVEALIGAMAFYGSAAAAAKAIDWLGVPFFEPDRFRKSELLDPVKYIQEQLENHLNKNEFEFENDVLLMTEKFLLDIPTMVNAAYDSYQLAKVEHCICYRFTEKYFLVQAFTHSSYEKAEDSTLNYIASNQRLKFIGESILDYLVSHSLYGTKKTSLNWQQMVSIRSALTSDEFNAALLVKYNLHVHIRLDSQELDEGIQSYVKRFKCSMLQQAIQLGAKTADHEMPSFTTDIIDEEGIPRVLAGAFKALIGALFVDSQFSLDIVWKVVYRMIKVEFDYAQTHIPLSPLDWLAQNYPNRHDFINYSLADKQITLQIRMADEEVLTFTGNGSSQIKCKMSAARRAVERLKKGNHLLPVPMEQG